MPTPITALWDRLWAKVEVREEGECWPWVGALSTKRGGTKRGIVREGPRGARVLLAHRVALCMMGEGLAEYDRLFPDGSYRYAAHRCGNRLCCNPGHLYWATLDQNVADRKQHDQQTAAA